MELFNPYIGGTFIEGGISHEIRNPYSNALVALASFADKDMTNEAIVKGVEAERRMRNLPAWKRAEVLHFIANELERNLKYHALLLSSESAKPMRYASAEITRAIQTFRIAAEESKRLYGELLRMDWTRSGEGREGIVRYFPIGLVAGISPFNFPLNLAVHKIAPAIASGCPIILKPSSITPLSTLALARIISQTDLPQGAVSILPTDRHLGNALVTDERIQLLSFTGSDTVGWKMKADVGKKKTVLELGGNAGVIIAQSVQLDSVIEACMLGAFSYSGQICIHAQRFFVHRTHYEACLDKMRNRALALCVGKPENQETEFSSMIDEPNAKRVKSWIDEAVSEGAELITGGEQQGTFVSPTILTNTNANMKVNAEEVFGPVITIEPYDDFEKAVEKINHTRFGLQAGVFTNDIREMDYAFSEIQAGGIILNQAPTLRFDHMPYGGLKDSGLGREGVRYAMQDMQEMKILIKSL